MEFPHPCGSLLSLHPIDSASSGTKELPVVASIVFLGLVLIPSVVPGESDVPTTHWNLPLLITWEWVFKVSFFSWQLLWIPCLLSFSCPSTEVSKASALSWAHPWQPCHPNNLLGSLLLFPYTHGWGCFTFSYWLQHQFLPQSGMTELVLTPYLHKCGIKENMLSMNFDVFLHFR